MGTGCSKKRGDVTEYDYFAGLSSEFDGKENFFKEIKIQEGFSVLVTRRSYLDEHRYYAVGSKCSHYGANLANGAMKDGKIYCPWHGACFDMESGDIEEFPGLDNIPKFQCLVKKDSKDPKVQEIYVHVEPDAALYKVMKPLAKHKNNNLTFAIIGSGPAGYMCAQTLRQEGFEGRILMFTADTYLPYDRPKLTKVIGCKWEDIRLRGKNFYEDNDIEVFLNSPVDKVETSDHVLTIRGKPDEKIKFDSIFLATGNRPRTYPDNIKGNHLKNILYVHNFEQAQAITDMGLQKRVVIVGSSFIAMELASSLKDKCSSITTISRSEAPYSLVFGVKAGKRFLAHLLSKATNVEFHPGQEVSAFNGNQSGEVTSVVTVKGNEYFCDAVIVAIGATPVVEYLDPNKFNFHEKTKAIEVDQYLQTNLPNVFAGGDCASFPIRVGATAKATIGHWQVALTHGRVAALNMLGHQVSIKDIIPFFWTTLCGINIRYCGYGEGFDEILIFGSMPNLEFCCLYRRGGKVVAAMGVGCDPIITKMAIELQTDTTKWQKEFPNFLVERFPDPPSIGLTESESVAIAARSNK